MDNSDTQCCRNYVQNQKKKNTVQNVVARVLFVGGEAGELPPHLPTGWSENLGAMERGRGGKGEREGWGRPPALLPPTGFCLKYHPGGGP